MRDEKRKNIGVILGISILFIMVIGVTYAAFQYTKAGSKENELTTGTISFKYNETSNGITLSNAMPMQDSEGKNMQKGEGEGDNGYFDFNVDSHLSGDMEVQYYVYAVDVTGDIENKLDPKYVKVYLTDQSSPENVYEGYKEEVPVYTDLDDIEAQSSDKQPVQGKLLYQNKFTSSGTHFYRLRLWVSNEYEDSKVARTFKMRVDVNTDAEIIPKDQEKPTCEVVNASPKNASKDEDITMTIKCSDDNGTVTSNMTKDSIHVKVNNEEVEPTKKELSEGIATAEVTGNNGVQHTLTLNGFEKEGPVSISIDAGVVEDQYKNTNEKLDLTTDVTIAKRLTVKFEKGEGVSEIGEESLYCDIKDDSNSCQVQLPTITPTDEGAEVYWAEDAETTEGKAPGTMVDITEDNKIYYAKAKKEFKIIYEKNAGVESLTKESDSCVPEGDSCEVTLPTIKGKTGYTQTYWGESIDTAYSNRYTKTTVTLTQKSTTYYAFANDTEKPICKLNSATPSEKTSTSTDVVVKIDCTDTAGTISKDLTADDIVAKVQGVEVSPSKKTITNTTTITNGKQYTITMNGFGKRGVLVLSINANAVTDASNNGNTATTITPNITLTDTACSSSTSTVLGLKYNSNTNATYEPGCDSIHNMYKFTQPDGSTGYRYIGDDPYNYVTFNGENAGWRIIGVFTDENSSGNKTNRIKLIRDTSIGSYSWDNTGVNNWARPASLYTDLNTTYWGSLSGQCGSSSGGKTKACNFTSGSSTPGLKSVQSKIENMTWKLGGASTQSQGAEAFYTAERGSTVPSGASATKTGYVGLAYPSDYGYTYGAGFGTTDCFSSSLYNCKDEPTKSWMLIKSSYEWLLTPYSSISYSAFFLSTYGYVSKDYVYGTNAVQPVVYLKSNISVSSGTGSKNSPYVII